MREPGNHDNGASDVWALTAYRQKYKFIVVKNFKMSKDSKESRYSGLDYKILFKR